MPKANSSKTKLKPPLVLIHGLRGSPLGLEAIAGDLEKAGYEVFLPSVPPFAGTAPLPTYSPKTYVQFFTDFLKNNSIEKPVFIGHSMSSIIASAIAEQTPELLNEKLILLSPISTKPARFFANLTPLSAYLPSNIVDYLTTKFLFVPRDHKLFQETLKTTHACSSDRPPKARDTLAAARFSVNHSVADFDFQKQTLLLAGETDRLIKKSATEKLAKQLNAKLVLIPKTGHLHNYEKPHETAEEIIKFLEQN